VVPAAKRWLADGGEFSASSRHRDLNRSATNIPSAYRIANIALNDAMILPYNATPRPDGIFGKDTSGLPYTSGERRVSVLAKCHKNPVP